MFRIKDVRAKHQQQLRLDKQEVGYLMETRKDAITKKRELETKTREKDEYEARVGELEEERKPLMKKYEEIQTILFDFK